jgi:DnaK suppressor protein
MPTTKSPYPAKELKVLKADLLIHREQVQAQFDEISQNSFAGSQTEMTGEMGFDEEYADAGSDTFEREKDLSLVNNLRDLLDKIDKALAKIEDGTYGLCDRCGKPIEKARVKALPYASLCLKDKQAEERVR